jgi:hypothetical protein
MHDHHHHRTPNYPLRRALLAVALVLAAAYALTHG